MPFCAECGANCTGMKFCQECGKPVAGGVAAKAAPKAAPAPAAKKAPVVAAKKAPAPAASSGGGNGGGKNCDGTGSWQVFDGMFSSQTPTGRGSGIASLKSSLPATDCAWAVYRYDDKYLVRIKWRPEGGSPLKKVKANQTEKSFLQMWGAQTKVTVEVTGSKTLTHDAIWECIRPGSGSKVISD